MRLSSRAFLDSPANEPPRLKLEWLAGQTEGIIALTGGPGGPLDAPIAAGQSHLAGTRLDSLIALFGDRLYVELQRHGTAAERVTEPVLLDLAYAKNLPLVAANEPFFATAADFESHDALICIAEGKLVSDTERRHLTPEHPPIDPGADFAALFGWRGRQRGR
jgi:DNA polymerase-3 subunit alpha